MLEQTIGEAVIAHLKLQLIGTEAAEQIGNLKVDQVESWSAFIRQIQIAPGEITIMWQASVPGPEILTLPFTLRRRVKEQRLIIEGQGEVDETLVYNIALGRELYALTKTGVSLKAAADQLGLTTDAVKKLLPLAYLSPRLVEWAVKGNLPICVTSKWIKQHPLPASFDEQHALINSLG